MAKRVILLGSTGSIGRQSLEVIEQQGYSVVALAAGSNAGLLCRQIEAHRPKLVAVASEAAAEEVRAFLAGRPGAPRLLTGPAAARQAVEETGAEADVVLNAIVGFAGLDATLTALGAGLDVALANKESLVAGGRLVKEAQQRSGARLLPVDSEHSAIFQCLQDREAEAGLAEILLTASGGPFYGRSRAQLADVTVEQALKHPNWSMGPKITIDSATLMNKGLELIEAMWLFNLPPESITVVVHPQSIIHSMVRLQDNSVLGQLGVPDMRLPIQYALTWPRRVEGLAPRLDFFSLQALSFGRPDEDTFRCLAACRAAAGRGGLAPCAANAAGEEAVRLFLKGEIGFLDIGDLVSALVEEDSWAGGAEFSDVLRCDTEARRKIQEKSKKIRRNLL